MRMWVLNCVNVMTSQDPKPYGKGCLEYRYCCVPPIWMATGGTWMDENGISWDMEPSTHGFCSEKAGQFTTTSVNR